MVISKMHEENRGDMMSEGIQPMLCRVFEPIDNNSSSYLGALSATCGAIQAQMVDDDNRKAGSDAHGRAKAFVTEYKLLDRDCNMEK